MNFDPCNINPREAGAVNKIASKAGYYLLRLESIINNYGIRHVPVRKEWYVLMHAFIGAGETMMGECGGLFLWDLPKDSTITGYADLNINEKLIVLEYETEENGI